MVKYIMKTGCRRESIFFCGLFFGGSVFVPFTIAFGQEHNNKNLVVKSSKKERRNILWNN